MLLELSEGTVSVPEPSSLAFCVPITSPIELRICSACPSRVGLPLPSENSVAGEDEAAGICCGSAGWLPLADDVSARAEPAVALDVAPVEVAPADPARAAATPAAAPSIPAAPAVIAVTAVPTIATAVLPTSPLTIRFATN